MCLLKTCFLLCVAQLALCRQSSLQAPSRQAPLTTTKPLLINSAILQDVFGSPPGQAVAMKPENDPLVDLDYWDSDNFTPSRLDYDSFDWMLTKRVAAYSKDNFLLSPLSLKLTLAILSEAATGATKSELQSVIGFDENRLKLRSKFSAILSSLKTKSTNYILDLGSRIYIGKDAVPRQSFAAIAKSFYKTELKQIDFDNPAVAADEINIWVANVTKGRIPKIVNDADVAGAVVMMLNSLFFQGTWRNQFQPTDTAVGQFYVTPTNIKPAKFMHLHNSFHFADSMKLDAKILRLPYLGRKFSMYIVVPNTLTGLPRVMSGLADIRQEILYLKEQVVDVTLPRFKFDYTSHLNDILKEMGIRQAFEDTASFPGVSRGQTLDKRLKVSKVLQKAGIEVNELGSTAYVATEVSLVNKFGADSQFVANRPFFFFIEDETTKQLLFTGSLVDPTLLDEKP